MIGSHNIVVCDVRHRFYYSGIFICNAKLCKIANQDKTHTCKCLVGEKHFKMMCLFLCYFFNFLLSVSLPKLLCMAYPLDAQAVTSKTRASQLTTAVTVVVGCLGDRRTTVRRAARRSGSGPAVTALARCEFSG